MPTFHFHLKIGAQLVPDEMGLEAANIEEARSEAVATARELLADAILTGSEPMVDAVIVVDGDGNQLIFVPVGEALPRRFRPRAPAPQEASLPLQTLCAEVRQSANHRDVLVREIYDLMRVSHGLNTEVKAKLSQPIG
jgi:hypothetical protein